MVRDWQWVAIMSLKFFEVTFTEAGIPALKRLHSIKPALGLYTTGVSFDRAGNVYAVSYSDKRLGVWALPKAENRFTTPAKSDQILVITTGINKPEINLDVIKVYPNPATDKLQSNRRAKNYNQCKFTI